MKRSLFFSLIFFSVLLILGVSLYKYAIDSPYRISAEEAKQRITGKKIDLILDVRTQMERDTLGLYPNSVHIPSADLDTKAAEAIPHKNTRILVYCNTGQRARLATEKLREMGYKNTFYISGPHTSIL